MVGRLLREDDSILKKTIGKAKLMYDELFTAFTEVEGII